jgi:hypothetical protein
MDLLPPVTEIVLVLVTVEALLAEVTVTMTVLVAGV